MSKQERMSIEDMRRFLPPEARFVASTQGGAWLWYSIRPRKEGAGWRTGIIGTYGDLIGILPDLDLPWDESLTEIRPKPRWRAQEGDTYWFISTVGVPTDGIECGCVRDANLHVCGNYWGNETQAYAYADACKELAMRMHEET